MTKKEREELIALCKKWDAHVEYSDDYAYSTGVESGYEYASYALKDFLSGH